jgi:hypothetical protein
MRQNHILFLRAIVIPLLVMWVLVSTLIWILRDGLGPDMVETAGMQAVVKFLGVWGIPAAVMAGLVLVMTHAVRRAGKSAHH